MFLNPKDQDVIRKVRALEDDLKVSEPVKDDEVSYKELYPDDWVEVSFQNKQKEGVGQHIGSSESDNSDVAEEDQWSIEKSRVSEVFKGREDAIEASVKSVDKEETKKESQTIQQKPSRPAPVITHTLVDLYCAQEHFDKAREILEKILELNPDDEKSLRKLEEINSLENRNSFEEAEHEKLLNYIESKVKNKNPRYDKVSEKFTSFLNALRAKASAI